LKLLLALLFFATSPLFCRELDSLWQEALHSPADQRIQKWTHWIEEAKTQNIVSPEAYFNLAQAHWSQEQVSLAVYNLLLSAQLRPGFISAWRDLALLTRIQRALLDAPSPLELFSMKLFILCKDQIKVFGKLTLGWIFLLMLFLRFGFVPPKKGSLVLAFLGLVIIVSGLGVKMNQKGLKHPSILTNQNELVPVYRTAETSDDIPILELPSGLIIASEEEKGDRIKIDQPTSGWIKKEMMLPFPRII
jgi:hypothetical protein